MKLLGPVDYKEHRDFLALIIGEVDLFASLTPEQLEKLIYFLKFVEFEQGETVFNKGDEGDAFYVIYAGKAEARAPSLFLKRVINTMGPKAYFGELALMLKKPRTATIVCTEPTQCFRLDRTDFEIFMDQYPEIAAHIREEASARYENYH